MKNIIIKTAFILIAVSFLPLAAQNYVGVTGGANISNFRLNVRDADDVTAKSRTLYGFGAAFGLQLSEGIYLHTEPMFLQKGSRIDDNDPEDLDVDITMEFIEVPVMLKFEFGDQAVKPFFMGGASMGFLLSSTLEAESAGFPFSGDVKDITNSTNFSGVVGAGVSIDAGKATILLEGLYNHGFTNLNKGGDFELRSGNIVETGNLDPRDEFFTKGFQVQAGVVFPIGG